MSFAAWQLFDIIPQKIDTDRYVNALTSAIGAKMGTLAATLVSVKVQRFGEDDKEICLVEVQAAPDPIYSGKDRTFYVRVNNSTRKIAGPDLVGYVLKRWG